MVTRFLSCGHQETSPRHCGRSDCHLWVGLCDFHSGRNTGTTCNQAGK